MRKTVFKIVFCLMTFAGFAQATQVEIKQDNNGTKLVVNGEDFVRLPSSSNAPR